MIRFSLYFDIPYMRIGILAALLLSMSSCAAVSSRVFVADADTAAIHQVALAFYGELQRRKVESLPQGDDWAVLVPLVTDELAAAIGGAQAEQGDFIAKYPDDKPPWIEGALFSSAFEEPDQFELGVACIRGDRAELPVRFTSIGLAGHEPHSWADSVLLRKSAMGWRIDDVRYEGGFAFGNSGTLKENLESLDDDETSDDAGSDAQPPQGDRR